MRDKEKRQRQSAYKKNRRFHNKKIRKDRDRAFAIQRKLREGNWYNPEQEGE